MGQIGEVVAIAARKCARPRFACKFVLGLSAMVGSPAVAQAQSPPEIIVTGEKQAVSLHQTTSSVMVLQRADIDAADAIDIQDAYDRAVNVSPTYGSGGFSIRGVANIGVSGAGDASTISVFVDGVQMASTFLQAAPTDLWDAASVEIFRGPQSTIQGLNSLMGSVIIRTEEPSLDAWNGRIRTRLTDEAGRQFAMAFGGPLTHDGLGARLSVESLNRDGFIRNVTRKVREDREERLSVRGKFLWRPVSLPDLTAKLSLNHFRRRGGFFMVYARTDVPDPFGERIATDNEPNRTDLDFDAISGEVRFAPGGTFSLTSNTTWSKALEASRFDLDYSPADANFGRQRRKYRTFTQEVRVNVHGSRLSGVAGLFLYDRKVDSRTISRTDVPTPTDTISGLLQAGGLESALADGIAAAYTSALPTIRVNFSGSFPTTVRSYAAFGDFRFRLADRLNLLIGGRFDHEVTIAQNLQQSTFAGLLPDPAAFGPIAPVVQQINAAVGSFVAQSKSDLPASRQTSTALLPKAGLLMNWSDDVMTAFVVQRAYRSGGLSTNIARGKAFPYEPEYAWNYELSLRSRLLDDRLRVNANAYYMDWRHQQVSVNFGLNSFDQHTVNAGSSRLYGFEFDLDGRISKAWSVRGAIGYQRTKFGTFEIDGIDNALSLSGQSFAFAPRWTLTGGGTVRLLNNLVGNFDVKSTGKSFGAVGANQASYRLNSHTRLNANVEYRRNHWSMRIFAKNLFGERYIVYKSPREDRAVLGDPRTVGIQLQTFF